MRTGDPLVNEPSGFNFHVTDHEVHSRTRRSGAGDYNRSDDRADSELGVLGLGEAQSDVKGVLGTIRPIESNGDSSKHGPSTVTQTEARLESYFASRRGLDGIARMRLRVPANGTSQEIFLDREVRIEAWHERDDQSLNDLIRIRWSPEGRIVFPKFTGTLVVSGVDDAGLSYIELDGEYKPPLGAAGEVFDEAIGHRLAVSTAREFLNDLKHGIETASKSA